ncbi:MAG: hypothetical protein WCT52_00285 [Candidatus Micrarchaeia archaeon]
MKRIAVLLAALILLFGCAMPIEPVGNASIKPIPKLPSLFPEKNATNVSSAKPLNGTNGSGTGTDHPLEPSIVPRNISDRIDEGQFDLPDPSDSPLLLYAISAGNADAILVKKGEFHMLIDNGNAGLVDAKLKNMSINRLDVVVATKDSADAFSGISQSLDDFAVGELWDNGNAIVSGEYAAMREKARAMGVVIKHPRAGDHMEIGGLRVYVLNPQGGKQNSNPDNDAIVLKVQNKEFCIMLLNPIVQDWENAIITAAGNESIKCGVMTYFKHGEGRPVPPIAPEKIGPKDAIISVGSNTDGLPSPTTLARLSLAGIRVWRTDTNGTIQVANYGSPSYEVIPEIVQKETDKR